MKILVVRFSSIGDIVLTTPIVRCLKQQLPGCEVHFLTKKSFYGIVEHNPNINKIHTISKSIKEIIPSLKAENFDYVVDLHNNIRTKSLSYRLGVPTTRFPKLNRLKWLYVQFKINKLPAIHIVERYFEAVRHLGIINDKLPCDYFIHSQDDVDTSSKFGLLPNQYVAFAIGAQFATKRLPDNKLRELCENVSSPLVLLGGKDDAAMGDKLSKAFRHVVNLCGTLNLSESASVVKQARVVISHDTGLMHIASAFNKPIVSVWGNTTPALGMYPYMPTNPILYSIHEVANLGCRPCSKIGFSSCPKKHFSCMQQQDIKAIALDVERR
jgi:lipopolysaccharide heptosyltransferase II